MQKSQGMCKLGQKTESNVAASARSGYASGSVAAHRERGEHAMWLDGSGDEAVYEVTGALAGGDCDAR